jgi:hypothetical protein
MTNTARPAVQCPGCKTKLFDGEVFKGISVMRIVDAGIAGMCKRCKHWVVLPLVYRA